MQVLIRDYRSDDLGPLLQLWERTEADDDRDEGLPIEQAVRLLGDERAIVLVAESDGRLVGAALAARAPVRLGSIA